LATNSIDLQRSIQFLTPEQEADSVAVGAEDASDKIAVLILAAGQSRRMLGRNKLLQPLFGLPMIDRVVRSALSSKADYVYVVTGHQAEIMERRLKRYDVKTVRNPEYASGVLGSARLGLSVLPPDVAGAVVLPADMPGFTEEYIDMLIDAFDPKNGKKVCLPTLNGVRHNPVLWAKSLFPVFKIVPEDAHWSPALVEHTDYMVEIPVDDPVALTDINTQGDLAAFEENVGDSAGAEMELDALSERMESENP
jgi:molybdenum cofactor cytidylyltransferase